MNVQDLRGDVSPNLVRIQRQSVISKYFIGQAHVHQSIKHFRFHADFMNTCSQSIHTELIKLGFIRWILRHIFLVFLLAPPSVKFKMLWQTSYWPHSKPVCQVSWWLDQYLMRYGQFLARSHLCKFSLDNTSHIFQQFLIIFNTNVYNHLLRLHTSLVWKVSIFNK